MSMSSLRSGRGCSFSWASALCSQAHACSLLEGVQLLWQQGFPAIHLTTSGCHGIHKPALDHTAGYSQWPQPPASHRRWAKPPAAPVRSHLAQLQLFGTSTSVVRSRHWRTETRAEDLALPLRRLSRLTPTGLQVPPVTRFRFIAAARCLKTWSLERRLRRSTMHPKPPRASAASAGPPPLLAPHPGCSPSPRGQTCTAPAHDSWHPPAGLEVKLFHCALMLSQAVVPVVPIHGMPVHLPGLGEPNLKGSTFPLVSPSSLKPFTTYAQRGHASVHPAFTAAAVATASDLASWA